MISLLSTIFFSIVIFLLIIEIFLAARNWKCTKCRAGILSLIGVTIYALSFPAIAITTIMLFIVLLWIFKMVFKE